MLMPVRLKAREMKRRQAEDQPDDERRRWRCHKQDDIAAEQCRLVAVEDDGADGAGAGGQRHAERHHRHVFPLFGFLGLLRRLARGPHVALQHGKRVQQDQDPAAHLEGGHADAEETQDQLARQ